MKRLKSGRKICPPPQTKRKTISGKDWHHGITTIKSFGVTITGPFSLSRIMSTLFSAEFAHLGIDRVEKPSKRKPLIHRPPLGQFNLKQKLKNLSPVGLLLGL